jgi:hypothetical protein
MPIGSVAVNRVPLPGGLSTASTTAEGCDAIVHSQQSAALGVRPADAVVPHLDLQCSVMDRRVHPGGLGVGVLHDVRERLGHDEVGARLDLGREPLGRNLDVDVEVEPRQHGVDAAAKTSAGQVGGQDPVCQLAELVVGLLGVHASFGHQRLCIVLVPLERPLGEVERDHRVDESLLRAVVEVPYEAATGRVCLGEQPRPRRGALVAAVGVGDRRLEQPCELGHALMALGRRGLLAAPFRDRDTPWAAVDDDGRACTGAHPQGVEELSVAFVADARARRRAWRARPAMGDNRDLVPRLVASEHDAVGVQQALDLGGHRVEDRGRRGALRDQRRHAPQRRLLVGDPAIFRVQLGVVERDGELAGDQLDAVQALGREGAAYEAILQHENRLQRCLPCNSTLRLSFAAATARCPYRVRLSGNSRLARCGGGNLQ